VETLVVIVLYGEEIEDRVRYLVMVDIMEVEQAITVTDHMQQAGEEELLVTGMVAAEIGVQEMVE
jgi:hypothetical protein